MTEKKTIKLAVEICPHELACRMLEADMQVIRPAGKTAYEAMMILEPVARSGLYRQAKAAVEYLSECIGRGQVPS